MKTQKRTFLGIDITPRKSLYAEIEALTEENREQANSHVEGVRNAARTLSETTKRHENETAELKAKLAEFEEKYNAAVKYQQNTQAAYDELKADYERLENEYDAFLYAVNSKEDAAPEAACETAKETKTAQGRSKNGRFAKKKRDDDPRK